MTTTYTAIYQVGYAIYGTGINLNAAIDDAQQWLDQTVTADDLGDGRVVGELTEITITERLFNAVAERGGDVQIECIGRDLYDLAD